VEIGLTGVRAISGGTVDISALTEVLTVIDRAASGAVALDKSSLVRTLSVLLPELEHRETGLSLDRKM
jgi:hypothetical protein